MKISDQNIQLSSQHYAMAEHQKQRVHETFVNGQLASRESLHTKERLETFSSAESALNLAQRKPQSSEQQHKESFPLPSNQPFAPQHSAGNLPRPLIDSEAPVDMEQRIQLSPELIKMIEAIEAMMERMTGKPYTMKVMGYTPQEETAAASAQPEQQSSQPSADAAPFSRPPISAVMGERTALFESYSEQEFSHFEAQGQVSTADGRHINFSVNAAMHRSFQSSVHIEQSKGLVLKDPLVVNFGGEPASLSLEKINFDIDSDGQQDTISFVESGSGFLALDKNRDGTINSGQELFGTVIGDGFAELSQYDLDQNGWIDENDAIFSQLQVWHRDEHGFEQLQGLLELNIGAIYLQKEQTPFTIKDHNNNPLGQVVSSGVFLHENGGAGSVQQIDLVV